MPRLGIAREVEQGWTVAQSWKRIWDEQLKKGQPLSTPSVSSTHKVCDALNAAWLCRIDKPDNVIAITAAAQGLCQAIIEKQGKLPKPPARRR